MQFKHPELLWALLLLLIPIIIHLFQLRRFQNVEFTNVKFLKNVKLQTRKSSQLKKWLTLITRLLIILFAVIAFAQPFTSNLENFSTKSETVIYIDNSFSMEAKGNNGSLLNEAVQSIISNVPENESVTIYTNEDVFRDETVKSISNDLIQLKYSTSQLTYESAYIKGKQYFTNDPTSVKNLVLLSDFQQKGKPLDFEVDSTVTLKLVQPTSIITNNISIDSAYIAKNTSENIELNVVLSHQGNPVDNVSVSLINDNELIAKTAVNVDGKTTTTFTLPNNQIINGEISIEDAGLQYDNRLYFNINAPEKINVLSINEASDGFLRKLYTNDEFNFQSFESSALNYTIIGQQNLIILNELKNIPNALINALRAFKIDGGTLLIIPSTESNLESYNQLLNAVSLPSLTKQNSIEKRLTAINYDHPIIENAFYNRVSNFQYPKVNTTYNLSSNANAIFNFEDGNAFLVGNSKSYLFSTAINESNSNFKNSPLIVPILYNLGKQSLALPKLYYTIGTPNTIDISTQLAQDDILTFVSNENSTIPLQQTYSNYVAITVNDYPNNAGIVEVKNKLEPLQNLSFNYNRVESNLTYHKLDLNAAYTVDSSFSTVMDDIKSNTNINALWKWFVIFALVFLIIEMLILKYLK
ncbi:BatA domain-containing protein [Winogradskyella immobilis]|uniref:BatA domain-containing protein n=1 Tax=Winogradskyella immobilis TaxID=2816852 RepID=A0ABS8EQF2_9FLAO|nr:BatA domain-containing protein [Winogradskyella immobilis]MCC1485340.1 BatA domain-containing protein [Winogradskyella immobilis]MCG0017432.1 BatA domain-containing protein [Winogradskyella immobilis]